MNHQEKAKWALGIAWLTNETIDDLKRKRILHASEDDRYYYLLIKCDDYEKESPFKMIDKKSGAVREEATATWCIATAGLEEMTPPYNFKIG